MRLHGGLRAWQARKFYPFRFQFPSTPVTGGLTPRGMSIVLCILCLNVGVALGMVLSGIVREQRGALDTHTSRQPALD